jgi:hypothetical protein
VTVNSQLEDPWRMGVGFAVQMVFVFIDTDGEGWERHTASLPGSTSNSRRPTPGRN